MRHRWIGPLAAVLLAAAASPQIVAGAPQAAATWDNLVKVESRKMAAVYLLPGADFRPYTKVMIDPAEVAFKKGWQRDYNESTVGVSRRVSDQDAQRIAAKARDGFDEIIRKAYADAGYEVVTTAGPDVLRLSPAVFDLVVTAPDAMSAGRTTTWSMDAGQASLLVEVRDSTTGAVLGRAIDRKEVEDAFVSRRNSATNSQDFRKLFEDWSRILVAGLAHLKELSPVNSAGQPSR